MARYMTAGEAFWEAQSLPFTQMEPHVTILHVFLPGMDRHSFTLDTFAAAQDAATDGMPSGAWSQPLMYYFQAQRQQLPEVVGRTIQDVYTTHNIKLDTRSVEVMYQVYDGVAEGLDGVADDEMAFAENFGDEGLDNMYDGAQVPERSTDLAGDPPRAPPTRSEAKRPRNDDDNDEDDDAPADMPAYDDGLGNEPGELPPAPPVAEGAAVARRPAILRVRVNKRTRRHVAFIAPVGFKDRELFALYSLMKVFAASSFEAYLFDQPSYFRACVCKGLFTMEDTSYWDAAFTDVSKYKPDRMIGMFVMLLEIRGGEVDLEYLFRQHWKAMAKKPRSGDCDMNNPFRGCRDLLKRLQSELSKSVMLLSECLNLRELGLTDTDLICAPEVVVHQFVKHQTSEARDFLLNDRSHERDPRMRLNAEQRVAFDGIHKRVEEMRTSPATFKDQFIYANGLAGSGKTYLLNQVIASLIVHHNVRIAACSTTGIASSQLLGAVTCHRLFGLPVEDVDPFESTTSSRIKPNSVAGRMLAEADVIIIDEFPTLHSGLLDKVLDVLADIRYCADAAMLGAAAAPRSRDLLGPKKLYIFAGDWHQHTPVTKGYFDSRRSAASLASPSTQRCYFHSTKYTLEQPVRSQADPALTAFLRIVAKGSYVAGAPAPVVPPAAAAVVPPVPGAVPLTARAAKRAAAAAAVAASGRPENDDSVTFVPLPPGILVIPKRDAVAHAMARPTCTVLAPFNAIVREYNEALIPRYESDATPLIVTHAKYKLKNLKWSLEMLAHEQPEGCPLHALKLCVGCPVVVLRNLCVSNGLCNGTMLTVLKIENNVLHCAGNKDPRTGRPREYALPRIQFEIKHQSECVAYRVQFPVALAMALTISKSQGKTLPLEDTAGRPPHCVMIDMTREIMLHGNAYVGVSRPRRLDDLVIVIPDADYDKAVADRVPFVLRNVVYPEILRRGFHSIIATTDAIAAPAAAALETEPEELPAAALVDDAQPEPVSEDDACHDAY
jgi:ATP-dependent DNA helicase PIF1